MPWPIRWVWRPDPDGPRSIGVFTRLMGAPGDRNLVSFAANAGVMMKAPFKDRDNDSVGLAVTYIKVGSHVHDSDLDYRNLLCIPYGVKMQETTLEATYNYQDTPVDHAGGRAIHVQCGRRPEPERSDAAAAQHLRDRCAGESHVLSFRCATIKDIA